MGIKNYAPTLPQCCDIARRITGASEAISVELQRSAPARQAIASFRRVADLAERERIQPIPDHAVRVAKAAAGLRRSATDEDTRWLPVRLLFDSYLHPAASGLRDAQPSHRLLEFEAGDYRLHLRLEHEAHSRDRVFVGQLLQGSPAPRPVVEAPVLVLSGQDVVGRSLTSRFGEFQAGDLPSGALRICVLPSAAERIDIALGPELEEIGATP